MSGEPAQYLLWNEQRGDWCNFDVVGESYHGANIHRLLPADWAHGGCEVRRSFDLIPEPQNPHDQWAISVRADGHRVGYLPRGDCPSWANVIRRVVASGLTPAVPGRIYAFDAVQWDDWDGENEPAKQFAAKVQLKLGTPDGALPINNPPAVPYTLIPRSAIVQVTKEDEHTEALLKFVPVGGYGAVFVTLHESTSGRGASARSVVEVRIDDEKIGQLTPQMSQRFLPMIRHLEARGLVATCWGDIKGSAVAAEVRIDGIKANEADSAVLDGPPSTVPNLVAFESDLTRYTLPRWLSDDAIQLDARQSDDPRTAQAVATSGSVAPPLPPAGWYEDPRTPQMLRYWDGRAWTGHIAPRVR